MGPSGRGGNEVVGGEAGARRPSPALCESKQRVRPEGWGRVRGLPPSGRAEACCWAAAPEKSSVRL